LFVDLPGFHSFSEKTDQNLTLSLKLVAVPYRIVENARQQQPLHLDQEWCLTATPFRVSQPRGKNQQYLNQRRYPHVLLLLQSQAKICTWALCAGFFADVLHRPRPGY
jgi:hypothetical protein